tara:strand:- start:25623 stop:25880 length:258 start_codon:yes stop_codon:yes gene_type:complete
MPPAPTPSTTRSASPTESENGKAPDLSSIPGVSDVAVVEQFVKVPKGVVDALVNYLNGRPYAEVASGMQALMACDVVDEEIAKTP